MSLTRKLLKGMGLTDEQMDTIIEAHTDTVEGLKAEIERYKTTANALPDIQKQLEQARADLEAEKKSSWKVKYEAMKEDFENFKAEQSKKETHTAKETAYRSLLKEAGISEKRIDAVLRVSDVDGVELDAKGAIKGAEKLTESIKSEWSDFIVTTETQGADTAIPPTNNGGNVVTKDDIFKISDAGERQKAIAENIDLFGKV